jgi:hypothetical protein
VHALDFHEVDFGAVAFAGTIAGYVMTLAGLWAGRVPGLASLDIADFGRRYMVSDRPSAWMLGFVSHLANSVILTFAWASLIVPNLDWPRWASGTAFGAFLAIGFAGALVAPMAGLGVMGRKTGTWGYAATSVLVHLLWGLLVGVLYAPRASR